jgi:hypothetical protein
MSRWCVLLSCLVFLASPAHAAADEDRDPVAADDTPGPASMEYPGIQRLFQPSGLYIDHTYERSSDLSTMAWVGGSGRNYRVGFGATWKRGPWNFSAELPLQYTRLTIEKLQEMEPAPADRSKGALSLGDLLLGSTYGGRTRVGPVALSLGAGLRVRVPTHTMRFSFGLINGGTVTFGIPYYLHASPTLIAGATFGDLAFTMNQGVLGMFSKDIDIGGIPQPVPTIYFWESHYALSLTGLGPLTLWTELTYCHQLNAIQVVNFERVNGIDALSVQPGIAWRIDRYVVIAEARLGVTKDTQDLGIVAFAGNHAFLVRMAYRY